MPRARTFVSLLVLTGAGLLMLGCAGGPRSRFAGTYVRTWVDEEGRTRQVSGPVRLVLHEGGHYHLEGDARDLPPEGAGRWTRTDHGLELEDTSPAAGGFDRTLILRGTFDAAETDGGLVLTQENAWGHSHLLILDTEN